MSPLILSAMHLVLFIEPRPPMGRTSEEWHNTVVAAAGSWARSVTVTSEPSKADIRIEVGTPTVPGALAMTLNSARLTFPHRPRPADHISITVRYDCPAHDLLEVVQHELGHAFGLRHSSSGIMSPKVRRSGFDRSDLELVKRLNQP